MTFEEIKSPAVTFNCQKRAVSFSYRYTDSDTCAQQRHPGDAGGEIVGKPYMMPPFHLFNTGAEDLPESLGMVAVAFIARILIISAPLGSGSRISAGQLRC